MPMTRNLRLGTIRAHLIAGIAATALLVVGVGGWAATTVSAPLSQQGNGTIRDRITLPAKCLAPIILVHPNGSDTAYIAASGFETS